MKIGVSITAFNEKHAVAIVKHFEPYVDRVVVSVTQMPWFGGEVPDDTAERVVNETDAVVIKRRWKTEHEQRNATMELLRDMDYVIVSHCDTWFTAQDLQELKKMKLTDLHYATETRTYWKNYDTIIYPHLLLPTIIIRSDAKFHHILSIWDQTPEPEVLPITCHHVSWVKSDEEILAKIKSYSHANEIRENWYERFWLNWNDSMQDFGPTTPEDFKQIKHYSLPKELRSWQKYL